MSSGRHPALHGLIDQIPPFCWTEERRREFLDALVLVLDWSVPVRPDPDPEVNRAPGADEAYPDESIR